MPEPALEPVDGEELVRFFRSRGITEIAAVPPSALSAPPGRRPADLFPGCSTVIIFGKPMGDEILIGDPAETRPRLAAFKQDLLTISGELAGMLERSGSRAVPVNSVMVRDGKVKGALSLKHCARDAGLGDIGDNGLLISPVSGLRLGLGAVLTDRVIVAAPSWPAVPGAAPLCTGCGLCHRACPAGAFSGGEIDTFRCINITGAIPAPLVFLFVRLMGVRMLEPVLSRVADRVAAKGTARCSACLTACPLFKNVPASGRP